METALGTAVALDLEDMQEEKEGVLVKIEDIYGVRCGQSSNARPAARPVPSPLDYVPLRAPLSSYTHTCSDLCV